jgi:hypothetical protein
MKKIKNSFILKWTLLLLFNTSIAFAQEIEWQNTIGGSLTDHLSSIQQTSDGGFILGGQSTSDISGDKTENSLGGIDYWIVKTDAVGNIQWQNTIGGNLDDALRSVQQTTDGGYIIGGTSNSNISGDKTENSNGDDDYWIVKTDSIGNIQWQNTIGGSNDDWLFSIQQTSDGGFIIGGTSWSNTSGDKNENIVGMGGNDFWIVKADALGNIQWQNTIGGSNIDWLFSIKQSFDGGYFIGGRSTSGISGDKTENALGFEDYWIVKTDSVGNIQWQNTIGGNNTDALTTVELTADGGYIIGGFSGSGISGDKTERRKGIWDYWVLKIDSIGNIQWQRTIGGSGADVLLSLQQTDDGGYIFGGSSGSLISGDKTENSLGINNYWVIKTDVQGAIIWQNTIGGLGDDQLASLQQTNDGGFILGGHSNSLIAGDKTENSNGNFDYWMVKLTNSYNIISGKLFADLNSNSANDVGESVLTGRKVIEQSNGEFAFTDHNGDYSLVVFDSGNFTVSPQPVNWYNPVPASHSVNFTTIYETDSLNDFAFQPQGAYDDVCITISPLGNFRSGLNAYYQISYGNYGTTTLAPTVIFYPANTISFLSATVTPGQITPDSVLWNLPSLAPFQTGTFVVTVNVNSGLPIGTLINSSVHIEPYATDVNPSCNNSNWEVFTTGSFDPNDILVNEDTLTTTQLNNAPWLEYIIRFQNTGNDTAFTVKILNPIDTNKLNLSTFEFVNASHPVNLNWINYQRNMEFKFENILLPDSNSNEPLSHGFVRYRIQPKTNLSAGDSITNFAAIYFDFNEPVITNTAKTSIILPTGIASASPTHGKLHVFPNPAENSINISGIQLKNGKAQVRLTDIYGKLILEKTVTTTTSIIETNQLSNGVYLIQSGGVRATFVKQ